MKHRAPKGRERADLGPSQRQLRAGELVRHALAAILRENEIQDPAVQGVSITVTEVRMSPDLKHAHVFVEPLGGDAVAADLVRKEGGGAKAQEVVDGLNRAARFLRGRLGREVELKFTPDLKFLHDESFDEAARMNRLFDNPAVRRDLEAHHDEDGDED